MARQMLKTKHLSADNEKLRGQFEGCLSFALLQVAPYPLLNSTYLAII